MKLLSKRQMAKLPLTRMVTTAEAAAWLYFLLLIISITTSPASATIKGKINCYIFFTHTHTENKCCMEGKNTSFVQQIVNVFSYNNHISESME